MKKIGIVTFHRAVNYGAMLQALALQRAIKDMGEDSELIDYVDELYEHYKISYKTSNPIKSMAKYLLSGKVRLKNKRFNDFIEQNADISARIYNRESINNIPEEDYKFFFTGSDQVFNPRIVNFDANYLLGFVKDKNKCCSYAASIGLSELDRDEGQWLYQHIKDFKQILIREKTGQEVIRKIGINDSQLVCDPTFLLDEATWSSMENKIDMPEHYILSYGFKNNTAIQECIELLKKKTGLPILHISDGLKNNKAGYQIVRGAGPAEWLYLIDNADYIVTNSFHGMIFSFIFKRQVFVADSKDGTFSRMKDFLVEMDCKDRIIGEDVDVYKAIEHGINYNQVSPKLTAYCERSKQILKTIFKEETSEDERK